MRRLTKYEGLVLLGAAFIALTAVIGFVANMPSIFDLSLVLLLLLVLLGVMLAIVRTERLLTGQKRAREEIYQVLYSLHGNDKWTETQARKTRDLLRDNHQALLSEIRKEESIMPRQPERTKISPTQDDLLLFSVKDTLIEYSKRLRTWAGHAEALALMNRSYFLRDAYAYAATSEQFTASELWEKLARDESASINFRYDWLYRLGRLLAFQGVTEEDRDFALNCLDMSTYNLRLRSHRIDSLRLQVELLAEAGRFSEAREIFAEAAPYLSEKYGYLLTDLLNPFVNPEATSTEEWLESFNAPFRRSELCGIQLSAAKGAPFDRVFVERPLGPMPEGPLISVIMTSYAPDEKAFEVAAKSILEQTWQNLELIIIDDATPGGPPRLLDSIQAVDDRIRVIKLPENRGTYYARNVGLRAARGQYVTGQDSDDWSHPERLYRQLRALKQDESAIGVVVTAIRGDDNLFRVVRGVQPERPCEVSLMFPTEIGLSMGGYLESRKGADSEFRERLSLFSGQPVKHLDHPLYLTRLSTDSLSRSDFKRGWSHPNRRAFSNFMKHWHKISRPSELALVKDKSTSEAIPPKFRSVPSDNREFDYVFVADWRFDNAIVRGALAEITALQSSGKAVGIMQLAGLFPGRAHVSRLLPKVQSYINTGDLTLVVPDEGANIDVLIVRSAELLQFAPLHGFEGTVRRTFIIADKAASDWDGNSPIYHPDYCVSAVKSIFGTEPVWLAQDPAIHRYLYHFASSIRLYPKVIPYVLPTPTYRKSPQSGKARKQVSVVGRHTNNLQREWPSASEIADVLWPQANDSGVEVRLLGDGRCYQRKYGKAVLPAHWVRFVPGDIEQEAFYAGLDYFVFYPDRNHPQEFSYEALIAQASGCTVLLPPRFGPMHGHHAIIAEFNEVPRYIADSGVRSVQSDKVQEYFEDYKRREIASKELFVQEWDNLSKKFEKLESTVE